MNTNQWFCVLAQRSSIPPTEEKMVSPIPDEKMISPLEEKMILDKHKRIKPNDNREKLWRVQNPDSKLKPKRKRNAR